MTREALHELIDRIPEGDIVAAQRVLEHLARHAMNLLPREMRNL